MHLNYESLLRITLLISLLFTINCSSQEYFSSAHHSNDLDDNIDELLSTENLPGMVILIRQNNEIIHHKAYGYANLESQEKMTIDKLFRIYSMTKPITALTTLQVLDEKNITLDSPLQTIFPQFGQHPDIPLSTLMTHTSGFSYGFKINRWAGWLYLFSDINKSETLPEFIGHLADLPLLSEPGFRWRYSFSSDVQGAIVEELTDRKLSENMKDRIFSKLGMHETSFFVESKRVSRLAPMYANNWFGNQPKIINDNSATDTKGAESGGSGLVSTAEDYSTFLQLLITPNSYPNVIKKKHASLITTSQLPEVIPEIPSRYYSNSGYGYGMGVKLENEQYLSKGSFYWAGKGGTIFWVDPLKALSVVVMMQYEGGNKILNKKIVPMVYEWLAHRENTTH